MKTILCSLRFSLSYTLSSLLSVQRGYLVDQIHTQYVGIHVRTDGSMQLTPEQIVEVGEDFHSQVSPGSLSRFFWGIE